MGFARVFALGSLLLLCLVAYSSAEDCDCASQNPSLECSFLDADDPDCSACCTGDPCACSTDATGCDTKPAAYGICDECCDGNTCGDGQFVNTDGDCDSCRITCATCDRADSCLTCAPGTYRLVADAGRTQCGFCHSSCQTCSGPGPTDCDTCSSGFFDDTETNTCRRCLSSCETCDTADECIKCQSGFIGGDLSCTKRCSPHCNTCITEDTCDTGGCAEGYGALTSDSVPDVPCDPCPPGCATCTGSLESPVCGLCKEGLYKDTTSNQCVYSCPDGEYAAVKGEGGDSDPISGSIECKVCSTGCETCVQKDPVPSSEPFDKCLTCSTSNFLNNDEECVANANACDQGTYGDGNVCTPCPHACAACTSMTVCSACASGYALDGDACVLNCPDGKIEDGGNCGDCSVANCILCGYDESSTEECLGCPSTFPYIPATKLCSSDNSCPMDTYKQVYMIDTVTYGVCAPCNPRCTAGCTGPSRSDCADAPAE